MRTPRYVLLAAMLLLAAFRPPQQAEDATPPAETVKLVFIHHSTGENWLTDDYGDLGKTLDANNYFVSDTNYGWGPDSIGDRTDIPDWTEWFASENTPRYMQALFNESGQHSSYTRTLRDPGGENQIVMFKSCFPNSELGGSPNDPPGDYEDMTVAGAKYVYNRILQYFASRPDKLFIVVTAPPVSDPALAENARAFNQWLVNDWLRENNYALSNVAVFDFYNTLTSPDAHHRFNNGKIEHIVAQRNTLYYPSGDDHPSVQGSRKATEEFVPLLNVFYHRWKSAAPQNPSAPTSESAAPQPVPALPAASLLDGFEAESSLWEAFHDESTPSKMACSAQSGTAHDGARALLVEYDIAPNSWGTCAYFTATVQDWSAAEGLSLYYYSPRGVSSFDIDIYANSREAQETYIYTAQAPAGFESGYVPIVVPWSQFTRANWEENAGAPFAKPNQVVGMAFGIGTGDSAQSGAYWVDDLALAGSTAEPMQPEAAEESAPAESAPPVEESSRPALPCMGALAPLFLLAGLVLRKKP